MNSSGGLRTAGAQETLKSLSVYKRSRFQVESRLIWQRMSSSLGKEATQRWEPVREASPPPYGSGIFLK